MAEVPHPSLAPDPVLLTIERVGGQGDGIAYGADGRPVFIPLTLPGEQVAASVEGERGVLDHLIAASAERITPPCPHFGTCGGCAFQHWATAPYLAWKVGEIRAELARAHIETEILPPFIASPGRRRRVALHARRGPDGRVMLGFKGRRSWSVVPIETCVIAHPAIVEALPRLARLAGPFLEHRKSAPTLHVTVTDTGLDVDVTGVEAKSGGLSADARRRATAIAAEMDLARLTLAGELVYMAREPLVRFGAVTAPLPAGGFLQATAEAEAIMAGFATEALGTASRVADLFCGSGAFTFRLAERAGVLALDASAPAIAALAKGRASATGLKGILAEARDLFRRPLLVREMKGLDAVVFDPPRAGAELQAGEIARSAVPLAVGVSCNVQTFARDAAILVQGGFRLDRVLPVDQFLWSPHIELVGVFTR